MRSSRCHERSESPPWHASQPPTSPCDCCCCCCSAEGLLLLNLMVDGMPDFPTLSLTRSEGTSEGSRFFSFDEAGPRGKISGSAQ